MWYVLFLKCCVSTPLNHLTFVIIFSLKEYYRSLRFLSLKTHSKKKKSLHKCHCRLGVSLECPRNMAESPVFQHFHLVYDRVLLRHNIEYHKLCAAGTTIFLYSTPGSSHFDFQSSDIFKALFKATWWLSLHQTAISLSPQNSLDLPWEEEEEKSKACVSALVCMCLFVSGQWGKYNWVEFISFHGWHLIRIEAHDQHICWSIFFCQHWPFFRDDHIRSWWL